MFACKQEGLGTRLTLATFVNVKPNAIYLIFSEINECKTFSGSFRCQAYCTLDLERKQLARKRSFLTLEHQVSVVGWLLVTVVYTGF